MMCTCDPPSEKFQIYQDGAKHNEFIKPVLHGGQTFNYGAYVSLATAPLAVVPG